MISVQISSASPAERASGPIITRSISIRLARCCALILPGNSGAGALLKVKRDTNAFCSDAKLSKIGCVSARLPAASITFKATGDDGSLADCAHAAPLGNKSPAPVASPAPAMNVRREIPLVMLSSNFLIVQRAPLPPALRAGFLVFRQLHRSPNLQRPFRVSCDQPFRVSASPEAEHHRQQYLEFAVLP